MTTIIILITILGIAVTCTAMAVVINTKWLHKQENCIKFLTKGMELLNDNSQTLMQYVKLSIQDTVDLSDFRAAQPCDTCPHETTNCKKLILADGSHICVRDMSKVPSKAQ